MSHATLGEAICECEKGGSNGNRFRASPVLKEKQDSQDSGW